MLNIKPKSYAVQRKIITSCRRSMTGQLQGGGMAVLILCQQTLPLPSPPSFPPHPLPLLPSPPPPPPSFPTPSPSFLPHPLPVSSLVFALCFLRSFSDQRACSQARTLT